METSLVKSLGLGDVLYDGEGKFYPAKIFCQ